MTTVVFKLAEDEVWHGRNVWEVSTPASRALGRRAVLHPHWKPDTFYVRIDPLDDPLPLGEFPWLTVAGFCTAQLKALELLGVTDG